MRRFPRSCLSPRKWRIGCNSDGNFIRFSFNISSNFSILTTSLDSERSSPSSWRIHWSPCASAPQLPGEIPSKSHWVPTAWWASWAAAIRQPKLHKGHISAHSSCAIASRTRAWTSECTFSCWTSHRRPPVSLQWEFIVKYQHNPRWVQQHNSPVLSNSLSMSPPSRLCQTTLGKNSKIACSVKIGMTHW